MTAFLESLYPLMLNDVAISEAVAQSHQDAMEAVNGLDSNLKFSVNHQAR